MNDALRELIAWAQSRGSHVGESLADAAAQALDGERVVGLIPETHEHTKHHHVHLNGQHVGHLYPEVFSPGTYALRHIPDEKPRVRELPADVQSRLSNVNAALDILLAMKSELEATDA